MVVVFFFSSRRRHTRYWRDWSSDVCSSDLGAFVDRVVDRPAGEQGVHVNGRNEVDPFALGDLADGRELGTLASRRGKDVGPFGVIARTADVLERRGPEREAVELVLEAADDDERAGGHRR